MMTVKILQEMTPISQAEIDLVGQALKTPRAKEVTLGVLPTELQPLFVLIEKKAQEVEEMRSKICGVPQEDACEELQKFQRLCNQGDMATAIFWGEVYDACPIVLRHAWSKSKKPEIRQGEDGSWLVVGNVNRSPAKKK